MASSFGCAARSWTCDAGVRSTKTIRIFMAFVPLYRYPVRRRTVPEVRPEKRTNPDYPTDPSTSVQRSGLVWYPDCGPDLAEFTRDLAPGRAGILTDVDLTEQAKPHNAVGVCGMRGKAPNSGIGLGGEWEDLPSLPEVCRAQHVPLFPRRGLATPGEQHAGI